MCTGQNWFRWFGAQQEMGLDPMAETSYPTPSGPSSICFGSSNGTMFMDVQDKCGLSR